MSHPISTSLPSANALMPRGFAGPRGAFGGAAAFSATQSRDLELSITTDEGDLVTLSMHQEREVTAAGYRGIARHGHGRHAGFATVSVERSVEFSVQGDLNAQERADILALAKDLGRIAKTFFRDHLDAAGKALERFDDLGSLQGFTLELNQQRSVSSVVTVGGGVKSPALPLPIQPAGGGEDDGPQAATVPGCDTPVCGEADRA